MSGERLKDELTRIAERAPEVRVPDDLFARGRRATVRARVLVAAAAAACIALLATVAAPLVLPDDPSVTGDRSTGGVPDAIHAPPDGDTDLPLTPLDEVGPLAAAYVLGDGSGTLVVVTAEGRYRRIELPSYQGSAADFVTPLLSPDGTQLAYAADDPLTTYLGLIDLTTGDVARVRLRPELGAIVTTAQFSPDGDWLVWSGQAVKSREKARRTFRGGVIGGVVRTATGESRHLRRGGRPDWIGAGVCGDGATVRYVWPAFFVKAPHRDLERTRSWSRLSAEHGGCTPPQVYAQLDGFDDEQLIGWLPDGDEPTAVALRPDGHDEQEDGDARMSLVLVDHDRESRTVGTVAAGAIDLSLATGLMTRDHPTVPAGPSPWARPWVVEHWWQVALAVLGAALAGWVVVRARAVRG